ncbi:MAG: DUF507 family protein [Myxococcales bacterium]|nr:DUF507 family protein [Myxococcales bacterium]MCB9708339.1 DUF507 family protein [Myxococcales bacterium]
MKLYSGKISAIAADLLEALTHAHAIEIENRDEVLIDFESVMKEYLRMDRSIIEEAKNRMDAGGMGYGALGKVKSQLAKEKHLPPSDEVLPYLVQQILEMLFYSNNVAEVFATDVELREAITPILRKHMDVDADVEKEVRDKIKNLEEGTASFEVEYQKVMEQIKRKRGLI